MVRQAFIAAAALALVPSLYVTTAEAGRGKDMYVRDYQFDKPMNGYSGHAGAYYCDYVKLPNRKCTADGQCKIVSWTLRQTCY